MTWIEGFEQPRWLWASFSAPTCPRERQVSLQNKMPLPWVDTASCWGAQLKEQRTGYFGSLITQGLLSVHVLPDRGGSLALKCMGTSSLRPLRALYSP